MKYLFIVNPTAGRGAAKKKWNLINEKVSELNLEYEVQFTKSPGDGIFLAKEGVNKGYDVLVAVGGDGTVNEVIRGMIESGVNGKAKLGVIPAGTGNDLVKTLNIPRDINQAVEILKNFKWKKIDLGRVNGDYFINVVGVGFDGAVANEINKNIKWLKGTKAYLYGVLKVLLSYKSPEMVIKIDDDKVLKGKYLLVAVANGKYYGGGMMIAPKAEIDDGLFDIIVIKDVAKLEIIKVLPTIFSGNHIKHPMVEVYRGKKVYLESNERVLIQADGELKGILPMGFELEREFISILVP